MRRSRGNVLIMAVFISAFIFLLAAALTAQNRQNILLSLGEEHRTRASNGALAAMDFALHVMRTNPEWESLLPGRKGELENGGSWTINSITRQDSDPHIIRINVSGQSGFVSVERTRIAEEIKLSSSDNTVLFAIDKEGNLACLDQSFKWRVLGELPAKPFFMAANNGPLFGIAGAEYPYSPRILGNLEGRAQYGDFQPTISEMAPYLLRLDIDDKTMAWKKLEPVYQIPETGTPTGNLINTVKAKIEVSAMSKYTGPSAEWYTLAGNSVAADGESLYAHALHHFYKGAEGIIDSSGYYTKTKSASHSYSHAILKYENGSWQKFIDPPSPKTLSEQNTPSLDSIALAQGNIYSVAEDGAQVLKASDSGWQFYASCNAPALCSYNGSPCFMLQVENEDGQENLNYSGSLNLWEGLRANIEKISLTGEQKKAIIGISSDTSEADKEYVIQPEMKVRSVPYLSAGDESLPFPSETFNSTASCGTDFYCFASIIRTSGNGAESSSATYKVLAHYDGISWQLWPNGMTNFIKSPQNGLKTSSCTLLPCALACARYEAFKQPALNRYAIIMDI